MAEKKLCPFWNVEFCKYGDKCKIEHAQGDCGVEKWDRKICHKRQIKQCKFGEECKYFKKYSCQFLHYNNTKDQKTVTDITNHLTQKKEKCKIKLLS